MNRAVFLDRDGTIIRDRGYINDIRKVEFYSFTFDTLRELQKEFLLFILTNQPGVAQGFITKNELNCVHSFILSRLKEYGIIIKEIYCCPHKKEDMCKCRKPNHYFIDDAKSKYSVNLADSFVIGDHPSDIKLAMNVNAGGIYLLTGHGRKHYRELNGFNKGKKIKICRNLKYASRAVLDSK